MEGIVHVDRSDLVGSAQLLATEIVSVLDDAAGTQGESLETRETTPSRETLATPSTFCGSQLGWTTAGDFFGFLTGCSVGRNKEDLSRAIFDEPPSLTPSSTVVQSILPGKKSLPVVLEEEYDPLSDDKVESKSAQLVGQKEDADSLREERRPEFCGEKSSARQVDQEEDPMGGNDLITEIRHVFSGDSIQRSCTSDRDRLMEIRHNFSNDSNQRSCTTEFDGIRQTGSFIIPPPNLRRGDSLP